MDSNNATGVYVEALQIGARGYETIIYPFKRQPLIFHNMKDQHEQCSKKTRLFFFLKSLFLCGCNETPSQCVEFDRPQKVKSFFF